jgi:O-antigen/teichoic acid export membrane protein
MSVLILPAALMAALFSRELLLLWTRSPVTVEHTHLLLSLLVIGTALNGLMNLPYALQLAHAWTKLPFYVNVVAVVLLAPALVLVTRRYGAVGAASVWIVLNVGYVIITIQLMHRRLLQGEKWRWYARDVSLPLAACLAVAALGRWFLPHQLALLPLALSLAIVWLAAVGAAAFAAPLIRAQILVRINRLKVMYVARYDQSIN